MSVADPEIYAPQTKILERRTKDEIRIFEALFKGVSTRFGLLTIEKYIENLDLIFCQSFQNLRLGSIKSPITRCSYGNETSFKAIYDQSGFGDFGDWSVELTR